MSSPSSLRRDDEYAVNVTGADSDISHHIAFPMRVSLGADGPVWHIRKMSVRSRLRREGSSGYLFDRQAQRQTRARYDAADAGSVDVSDNVFGVGFDEPETRTPNTLQRSVDPFITPPNIAGGFARGPLRLEMDTACAVHCLKPLNNYVKLPQLRESETNPSERRLGRVKMVALHPTPLGWWETRTCLLVVTIRLTSEQKRRGEQRLESGLRLLRGPLESQPSSRKLRGRDSRLASAATVHYQCKLEWRRQETVSISGVQPSRIGELFASANLPRQSFSRRWRRPGLSKPIEISRLGGRESASVAFRVFITGRGVYDKESRFL
ncbi:hypothetical protein QBC47DRAFT_433655 [Echria macrotheca]|uniref:Uncharacterized protein n=1 Tax=Echria macrotheca TaxID=438768 RepID=A0AAJ0F2Z5_9PEZI|nr:hypothetical protein QBC47DRAFT_433655 [Echria macrotheca]